MTQHVLVTGGNGFLGQHIILQLLDQGYQVRTTLRTLNKQGQVIATLQAHGENTDQLGFVQADLSQDAGWSEAMAGIDFVLSVASPVFMTTPDDPEEVSRAAKVGILRILKAANRAKVKRVVMTANFGAVGFSNHDMNSVTTEKNWTDPSEKGISLYEKSKLLAEMAAWDYIKQPDVHLEFATINPVAILGKALDNHLSGSFSLVKGLLDGSTKRVPDLPLNVVDVRDVADLHIRAMVTPEANGERFIATEDGQISLLEIAQLIKAKRPELASQVADKKLPSWIITLGAPFNKSATEGKLMMAVNRNVSNQKARDVLGWTPISDNEQTILDTVDAIEREGKR
ncbi:SDR family oxidoreductase [Secundilactobacillus paracollinoides]|uniref:3-beta hydroxysteroid dehydrogenase n=1 Tax=Secundilactobacillus paracollinoides TaxID=240427 RepID=A0A1B2IWH9_9LACO|nr:aldehyde reductase [Secundilactobacillus paracollinoides]ANZ60627.1 3-beta hydroxysteroid dehydrogenase [Secundilactobacillus paracollinoides]ANZ66381.1 3-beta hydroxysteroid dehydrogenase [Secundilactobacillus paracollinoides]